MILRLIGMSRVAKSIKSPTSLSKIRTSNRTSRSQISNRWSRRSLKMSKKKTTFRDKNLKIRIRIRWTRKRKWLKSKEMISKRKD